MLSALAAYTAAVPAQEHRQQAEGRDIRLLGHTDLQARSGYHPVINEQNGRWIVYVDHHGGSAVNPLTGSKEFNGTSIVDVTDPLRPRYLAHIPGEVNDRGYICIVDRASTGMHVLELTGSGAPGG